MTVEKRLKNSDDRQIRQARRKRRRANVIKTMLDKIRNYNNELLWAEICRTKCIDLFASP